jgi:16S rRNA processing protein RimM
LTGRDRILLGRIAGAHGIRGEVIIHAFTDPPENVAAYGPLSNEAGARTFKIAIVHVTAKGVVARLEGVSDRTAAEALRGVDLYVDRDRLPAAADGEFYHADLIGMAAVDAAGQRIGEIVAVQNFGAGDLLEIRSRRAATELIPFTDAHVPEVTLRGSGWWLCSRAPTKTETVVGWVEASAHEPTPGDRLRVSAVRFRGSRRNSG